MCAPYNARKLSTLCGILRTTRLSSYSWKLPHFPFTALMTVSLFVGRNALEALCLHKASNIFSMCDSGEDYVLATLCNLYQPGRSSMTSCVIIHKMQPLADRTSKISNMWEEKVFNLQSTVYGFLVKHIKIHANTNQNAFILHERTAW